MNHPTTSFGDNKDTWRTASLVLCFALLISLAAHIGGPSSARAASPQPGLSVPVQWDPDQALAVGGFTTLDNQPAFVILDAQGQRIGALPMNTTPAAGDH